jgi:hypothetical protein
MAKTLHGPGRIARRLIDDRDIGGTCAEGNKRIAGIDGTDADRRSGIVTNSRGICPNSSPVARTMGSNQSRLATMQP